MKRKLATSDTKRLNHLRTITGHPDLTNKNGERLLGEEHLQKTSEIADELAAAIQNRNQARTGRREAARKRDRHGEALIRDVRAG